jgi:hypothetical protein
MSSSEGTPLRDVPGWPGSCVRKLAENSFTTAEQVVATCATPEGTEAMASHLGISQERMRQLVAFARASLPSETVETLEKPVDRTQFGFGALKPPDE